MPEVRIALEGISTSPSDKHSTAGVLAFSDNISFVDGELWKNNALEAAYDNINGKPVFLHSQGAAKGNLITLQETEGSYHLCYNNSAFMRNVGSAPIIEAVGNILCVATADGLRYARYNESSYTDLGAMPEVELEFALESGIVHSDRFGYSTRGSASEPVEDIVAFENIVHGAVANMQAKAKENNQFVDAFYVRYAIRLHDGSYIHHSAPVLMLPSWSNKAASPLLIAANYRSSDRGAGLDGCDYSWDLRAVAYGCRLVYRNLKGLTNDEWKDLIKGVDIFVSREIPRYDANGKVNRKVNQKRSSYDNVAVYTQSKTPNAEYDSHKFDPVEMTSGFQTYEHVTVHPIGKPTPTPNAVWSNTQQRVLETPYKPYDIFKKQLEEEAVFYKIASLSLDTLKNATSNFLPLSLSSDALRNLAFQETLPLDYRSHDAIVPSVMKTYNARLHVGNIHYRLFNGYKNFAAHQKQSDYTPIGKVVLITYLQINGKEQRVVKTFENGIRFFKVEVNANQKTAKAYVPFLSYPNVAATKMDVFVRLGYDKNEQWYESTQRLQSHSGLNIAYRLSYPDGFEMYLMDNQTRIDTINSLTDATITEDAPSLLLGSHVSNPFVFPADNTNTVGLTEIKAIQPSATMATISTSELGVTGASPLYVFTSDGIYACLPTADGRIGQINMASRDILTDPSSITNCRDDIAYFTEEGVCILRGTQRSCITKVIDGRDTFKVDNYDKISKLSAIFQDVPRIRELIEDGARMAYDKVNDRLLVFNDAFSFILDIESKAWTTQVRGFDGVLRTLQEDLLLQGGALKRYSLHSSTDPEDVAILTRPFQLSDSRTNIKRIFLNESGLTDIRMVLYASNNADTFVPIASTTSNRIGRCSVAARYYALAIESKMTDRSVISDITIDYEPRYTNRLR